MPIMPVAFGFHWNVSPELPMKKLLLLGCLALVSPLSLGANPVTGITISLPANPDANGASMVIQEEGLMKPVTFRWTPVVPRPRDPVTYRVRVWQLMQGQSGPQAMQANQPIVTKDVDNLQQLTVEKLITGPCKPPYLCEFVWNVQALNREGKPVGENNGLRGAGRFSARKQAAAR